ncbi:MAG: hypothetical protein HQL32_00710 [Planctomycetes bacterium]|nr:hypothetical protein [Planctomycetota bacterium]
MGKLKLFTVVLSFHICAALPSFAATLTWPSGDTGHWLTPLAWLDGATPTTIGTADQARVDTGTIYLTTGNTFTSTSWLYLGYTASTNSVLRMSSANLTFDRLHFGESGVGDLIANSSYINLTGGVFSLGINNGSSGNLALTDSACAYIGGLNPHPNIGGSGNGFLSLENSTMTGFKGHYIGKNTGSEGHLDLTNGSTLSTDSTVYVGDSGVGHLTIASSNMQSSSTAVDFIVGNASDSHGYMTLSSNARVSGYRQYHIAYSGNATLNMTSGANMSSIRNITNIGYSANTLGVLNMTDSYLWDEDGGFNDSNIGLSGNGQVTMDNSVWNVARWLFLGKESAGEGTLTLNNGSTVNLGNNCFLGYNGAGNLTVNESTLNTPSYLHLTDVAGSSANLILNSGNINIGGQLRIDNGGRVRLGGGSANLNMDNKVIVSTSHVWEHMIDKNLGPWGHMGAAEFTGTVYQGTGYVKMGVRGGAVFTSSNTFYMQVGTGTGTLSYETPLPSTMYDAPAVDTDIEGTTKDAISTVLSSANQIGSLDLSALGTMSTTVSSVAAGWAPVANVDSSLQRNGLNVLLQLASGSATNVINKLTEAGYEAETTTFSTYDLLFKVSASDLVNGTGYVIFDFRDIATGVNYATVDKVMVCPRVGGSFFYTD